MPHCAHCGDAATEIFMTAPCGHIYHEECLDAVAVGGEQRFVCPDCETPATLDSCWRTYWEATDSDPAPGPSQPSQAAAHAFSPATRARWRTGWRAVLHLRARTEQALAEADHSATAAALSRAERERLERVQRDLKADLGRLEPQVRASRERGLNAAAVADSAKLFCELTSARGEAHAAGLLRTLVSTSSRSLPQLGVVQQQLLVRMQAPPSERSCCS